MTCWDCAFNRIGTMTMFGECSWFERQGLPAKAIPEAIAETGCKYHKERPERDEN